MEVIHLLLLKSADDFVQEVASTCFIPLVFVVANDESENAGLPLVSLSRRSSARRTTRVYSNFSP